MKHTFKKVVLVILDGFGLAPASNINPVSIAGMPYLNSLVAQYPAFNVTASGLVVGLPWGKPGNSEVGHSAIGTGRVIIQDWARINSDIKSGIFYDNKALKDAVAHVKKHNSKIHFIGCTSPGGIHGHEDHAIALFELAAREKIEKSYLHMITDGEDAAPTESLATLQRLHPVLTKSKGRVASVIGRTFGMDRVLNWELTKQAWDAMVHGVGTLIFDPSFYLSDMHQKKIFDDQMPPAVVVEEKVPVATIGDNDAVIFFNYRNDRAKQMIAPFVISNFRDFDRGEVPKNLFVVSMTRYASQIEVDAIAYEAPDIHRTLGKEISRRDLKQFRVAEKEKEAHINNFFNGGRIDPYDGTEQVIVSSRQLKGKEYIEHPEMSAKQIVKELVQRMQKDFTLYIVNFANSDMMAHTGDIGATVEGLKVIDVCLQDIAKEVFRQKDCVLVVTCDHGNSEELIDPATGGADTQHSSNGVVALFAGDGLEDGSQKSLDILANEQPFGSLIDIAPTILNLLEFEKPKEMTGTSLL